MMISKICDREKKAIKKLHGSWQLTGYTCMDVVNGYTNILLISHKKFEGQPSDVSKTNWKYIV